MSASRSLRAVRFWDHSDTLTINNPDYQSGLTRLFAESLKKDMSSQDATTLSLFKEPRQVSATVISKEEGIVAGIAEIQYLLSDKLRLGLHQQDGRTVREGDMILTITGDAQDILSMERTILNILQRMSGIASLTNKYKEKVHDSIFILGTRKTCWQLLDNRAVSVGGGLTHRLSLKDAILIKDNHLLGGRFSVQDALEKCVNSSGCKRIELEVTSREQALAAARTIKGFKGPQQEKQFAILLDNMTPSGIRRIIKELQEENLHDRLLIEASGNITLDTVSDYADTGIDAVSIGALTHSPRALNFSMEVRP